ncbi:MAG: hypothetical protein A2027_02065 [Thermodesulfovibrio sp. RBG_19FT_COMBO_41_18]|nr:MAG: hypothetical protein A2027_02065 [Thermodesulfovibrio sp. RBG_19FT_COMBO_41_18]
MINKVRGAFSVLAIVGMLLMIAPNVYAQSVASQKAYFGSGTNEIVAPEGDIMLYGQIKTSQVGDLLIGVSMECSLWTATSNTATKGGGKTTSSSRAAVNVTVYVDGHAVENQAEPGQVVYCDREQTVNLTFSSETVLITDAITLEIFLKTKNANHFNFYYNDLGSGVHTVEVYVDSMVEFSPDSPQVVVDGTRAAIGKRSLIIEEYNNP